MSASVKTIAIETVIPALVGVGLIGYMAVRCVRGAWRAVRK